MTASVEHLESRRLLATTLINDSSTPTGLFDAGGGTVYFQADDGLHGPELFKSDGTAGGTTLVKDVVAGGVGAAPGFFTSLNGKTYFLTRNENNDSQLWKTDGTSAGTMLVSDLRTAVGRPWYALAMSSSNGSLLITGNDTSGGLLVKSDGTANRTALVKDFLGLEVRLMGQVGGAMLIDASSASSAYSKSLWRTDGTTAGTVELKNIEIRGQVQDSTGNYVPDVAVLNGEMYFFAFDAADKPGLWKSDGTSAGTVLVTNAVRSYEAYLTAFNNGIFFAATDNNQAAAVWRVDGTTNQLVRLGDFNQYQTGRFEPLGSSLYFIGDAINQGNQLWKTDGTPGGTTLVKDTGDGFSSVSGDLIAYKGALYFGANDGDSSANPPTGRGIELWKSDGTAAGTVMVKDLNPGTESSLFPAGHFVISNGTLFFAALDPHGQELWKSDGTAAGSVMVKDINTTDPDFAETRYTPKQGTNRVISGTTGDDVFTFTRSGIWFVVSRNGKNETFPVADGLFILEAGDGNDTVDASAMVFGVTVQAGEGDDSVIGGQGNDIIAGVGGNDTIFGAGGNDTVDGGAGDDSLWGQEGNDTVLGQAGVDSCYGNGGNDWIEGGANSDHIRGNGGRDRLYGNGGNDHLYGGSSGDFLYGQAGHDQLEGEGGNDRLYGDDGESDTLRGGAGDDTLKTLDGVVDALFGDGGHDSGASDANDLLTSIEVVL